MARVASVNWLRTGGIAVVNHIGSLSNWSWGIIFTLYCGKSELEQLDSAVQVGFELLSIIIDQYQQNDQSESFILLRRESRSEII